MSKRRLFSIGTTEITLHPAALVFAAYVTLRGQGMFFLITMASILAHEAAHGLTAVLLGEAPTELEWMPLGALIRLEDEQRLPPLRRLMMLAAGPLMTLLLCLGALSLTRAGVMDSLLGRRVFTANVALLLMNLLPCLPLDGGRMLSLLLSLFLRADVVARILRWAGTILGGLCVLGSLALTWLIGGWNMSLAACGCFLIYAASSGTVTTAMAELRQLMARKIALERRGYMASGTLAVMSATPLHRVIHALPPKRYVRLIILEPGTLRPLGDCDEARLIAAYLDTPGESCLVLTKAVDLAHSPTK